jgi:hypothetical protein
MPVGCQDHEIGGVFLEIPETRGDGIPVLGQHLSNLDAERRDRAAGALRGQHVPALEHLPNPRKILPLTIPSLRDVQNVELSPGDQRHFECVGKSDLATLREVGGVKDAADPGWRHGSPL